MPTIVNADTLLQLLRAQWAILKSPIYCPEQAAVFLLIFVQWRCRKGSHSCSLHYKSIRKVIGGRPSIQLHEGGIYGLGVEVSHGRPERLKVVFFSRENVLHFRPSLFDGSDRGPPAACM